MSAPSPSSLMLIALLMAVAGMGIPLMAAMNAGLGQQLGSPAAASAVLFGIGFVLSLVVAVTTGLPERAAFLGANPYRYGAAAPLVFYLIAITWSAPRIGLGNAVFFVLLGQLIAAAAIDHLGLFGVIPSALTWRRAAGIVVMAFGVYLARKPR